jgi:hypothetical protein
MQVICQPTSVSSYISQLYDILNKSCSSTILDSNSFELLVAELALCSPGFHSRVVCVEFVVDEVAQELGFLRLLWFLSVI